MEGLRVHRHLHVRVAVRTQAGAPYTQPGPSSGICIVQMGAAWFLVLGGAPSRQSFIKLRRPSRHLSFCLILGRKRRRRWPCPWPWGLSLRETTGVSTAQVCAGLELVGLGGGCPPAWGVPVEALSVW